MLSSSLKSKLKADFLYLNSFWCWFRDYKCLIEPVLVVYAYNLSRKAEAWGGELEDSLDCRKTLSQFLSPEVMNSNKNS
jgi:hypothetical protein